MEKYDNIFLERASRYTHQSLTERNSFKSA